MSESPTDPYADVDWFTDTSVIDDPYPYYRYLRDERGLDKDRCYCAAYWRQERG